MSDEEKKTTEYFKEKIKNKLPLYEETYVDGKPYRINILQLETNFTEEQANKTEILLNLIEKQQKELEELKDVQQQICNEELISQEYVKENFIAKDKIKAKVIEIKNRQVKDEFITASQGKLNTIIEIESLLEKE